jgi:CRP-like cAMP-binding protein
VASETTVLQSLPSPCDVVASTDTAVVSLPSRAFHGLLADAWFAEQVTARARGEMRAMVIDVRASVPSGALATSRL